MFPKAHRLQQHERSCEAKVKRVYLGGVYHPSQTIFEKIEEEGIAVPPELKYYRYRATFDIEVYYPAHGTNLPEKRDKLEYTAEHQLLSISVASNVPGYEEPQCFVVEEEGREAALQTVTAFVEHLETIAEQVGELERSRFVPLLNRLKETWGVSYQPPSSTASMPEQEEQEEMGESTSFDEDSDDENEEEDDEETKEDRVFIDDDDLGEENDLSFYRRVDFQLPEQRSVALPAAPVQTTNRLLKKRKRLLTDLHRHLAELVVVGFNSGKYDLNVLKDILIPHLVHRSGIDLVFKRDHAYLALRTGVLKFVDISNFVAAGTSYGAFLKAYQCQGEKGFFPYEHVRWLGQLEEPQLPAREAFHSWLKKSELSEEDYAVCQAREPGPRKACEPSGTFWSGTITWTLCHSWKLWTR